MVDLAAARSFVDTHARVLDRRRFARLVGGGGSAGVLAALDAYRNADGGYGWGLEPDLRASASQPVGALHALEVLAEVAPAQAPVSASLCEWLDHATLPDGGLPFACAGAAGPGTAPWWAGADPDVSSLHITTAVCAAALRVAAHDPAVAAHPWLVRATAFCRAGTAALGSAVSAYELKYALAFLDALADLDASAGEDLARLAALVPACAELPVAGGVAGEALRALDLSPLPGRPLRDHLSPDAVQRDLDRVAAGQRDDGGWTVDHATQSPASALEWRGDSTVRAIALLQANGRL